MSINRLMTRPVTVLRAAQRTDRYGNVLRDDWDNPTRTATVGWDYQQSGIEILDGRNAQVSAHILYLPAGTVIDGSDRVEIDGDTFELTGPPRRARRPTTGEHHVEADLKRVDG